LLSPLQSRTVPFGFLATLLLLGGLSTTASAKQAGISSQSCSGCHNSGATPRITLTPMGPVLQAGQTIRIELRVENAAGAGFSLWADGGEGTFVPVSGEGTKIMDTALVHTTPKRATGGVIRFLADWKPAATTRGVVFGAAVVGANMDTRRTGDSSNTANATLAIGCMTGETYFRDYDGDGHGREGEEFQMKACGKPEGFGAAGDDCNDNDERVFPGNPEVCNQRDDNCDNVSDEGLPIIALFEDGDGDGYGRLGSTSKMGCGAISGYGVGEGDCRDNDKSVHPKAEELCNLIDDDCNGRTDEEARTECGTGWCRRLASGCGAFVSCTPGKPRIETCNYFDDDCDGEIDEGADICKSGSACVEGRCTIVESMPEELLPDDTDEPATDGGTSGNGSPQSSGGCTFAPTTRPEGGLGTLLLGAGFASALIRRRRVKVRR